MCAIQKRINEKIMRHNTDFTQFPEPGAGCRKSPGGFGTDLGGVPGRSAPPGGFGTFDFFPLFFEKDSIFSFVVATVDAAADIFPTRSLEISLNFPL